jgi:OmpA-OmpF porin, OOP family
MLSALAAAAALCTGPATAQSSSTGMSSSREGWSLLPYTRRGYVGINVGRPDYDLYCRSGFACDDPSVGASVYTGGYFNDWIGAEIGYIWLGRAEQNGGRTRAEAGNLSLVARAPLGPISLHAKVGALYGRTRVSTDALSLVEGGKKTDWGAVYGVGASWDFAPQSSVVLEWMRHDLKFPNRGNRDVDMASVGYVFRF